MQTLVFDIHCCWDQSFEIPLGERRRSVRGSACPRVVRPQGREKKKDRENERGTG